MASRPTDPITKKRVSLSSRYTAALRVHLTDEIEGNGDRAQGLGRAALASGLVSRDVAVMHEQAILTIGSSHDFLKSGTGSISRAGAFLAEALAPLESAQRAREESMRVLRQRNEALRVHAAALAKMNRQLENEVVRRKASEEVVMKGKQQYHQLLIESQLMQQKLRQVTRQIIAAQEAERKEISRELHDEVVQTLVGINVQLSALCQGTTEGIQAVREKIMGTQRLVENSVTAVHRFARGLRPAVLDDLGLIPALHAYCKALAAQHKIKIHLAAFRRLEELDSDSRTALYRVAQESLTNVARHAEAGNVTVNITDLGKRVRMSISDDGKSFSVEKTLAKNNRRLGLVGMQERMEMLGGDLTIKSSRGAGTTVCAEIPFHRAKSKS